MRRLILMSALVAAAACDSGDPTVGLTPVTLPATNLGVSVQPTDVQLLAAISPAVQVQVRNQNGQLAASSTATVTMSLTPGTGTAGATLSGQLVVNAVNGIAVFNNLRINQVGTGYTLTATAPGLSSTTTSAFAVTP